MALQQEISSAKLQDKIGKTVEILIDTVDEQGAVGRSSADAPEIDGQIFLDNQTQLQPGDILNVEVEDSDEYDLWAHPIA